MILAADADHRSERHIQETRWPECAIHSERFRANVTFDDHPFDRRMAGQIDTVTTNAVVDFVRGRDPQARVLVVESIRRCDNP